MDKVFVIDNGSSDSTAEVARLAGAEVISHEAN
jgi:glycosyltransferase involved in cell wall biosynthesis